MGRNLRRRPEKGNWGLRGNSVSATTAVDC